MNDRAVNDGTLDDGAVDRQGVPVEEVLAALRERGGRVTAARRAIVSVLVEADGHLNAADISASVRAAQPDVHPSTVYRTLERLVELDVVEHIHLAHGSAVYHLTSQDHLHLVCDRCGVVTDAPATVLRAAAAEVAERHGFRLAVGHVALTGRCRDCLIAEG